MDKYTIIIDRKDLEEAFRSKRKFKKFVKDTFGYELEYPVEVKNDKKHISNNRRRSSKLS